ncbi:MAG TPA: histone deacetylase [Candidatus Binatia bacterium]|nr:histone deacetylase [Candidatus Binatia bacterium]
MGTVLSFVPALAHTQKGHPENRRRVEGLLRFFENYGVLQDLRQLDAVPADAGPLARVHTRGLLEEIRQACLQGAARLDADTYLTRESYELARLAAGACCVATDAICSGSARNGLAIVRPPGHHAQRDRVGGFCLVNNVAVAVRHAQAVHGVRRPLIVDFDVHHGNGTQDIFYEDGAVLFVSLHLYHPFFYPGTGAAQEIGAGAGRGFTVNVPFPPDVGDEGYARAFDELIIPRAREFAPDLILVSAGFDAHWQDPLGRASLSLLGYASLCRKLVSLADSLCNGRVLFVLEGGYRLEALHYGLLNLAQCLLGRDSVHDPLGPAPEGERDVTNLLADLRNLHLPNLA